MAFNSACNTLSTSGTAAISDSTDVAVSRIVSRKPCENKLIPMPTIAADPFSVSIVSASIPPSFRSLTQRSLGHLMSTRKPHAFTNASETASAAIRVSSGHEFILSSGRSTMLKYNPASFGDCQLRSRRPRPAVCSRATIHKPSRAPALACRIASRLVESIESNLRILKLISLVIHFAREESILATSELTNTRTQRYHCVASGLHHTWAFAPRESTGQHGRSLQRDLEKRPVAGCCWKE